MALITQTSLSQQIEYTNAVKAKMDQNKIDGLPITTGIQFVYTVIPNSEYTAFYPKDDNSSLFDALNFIKMDLSLTNYIVSNENNSGLIIKIYRDIEIPLDSIKWAFHNKNLKPASVFAEAILKD